MRRDLLVNALSEYSLEDIMSMVGESHQISKERKEIPQEKIQALANEFKELRSTKTIQVPINIQGNLKINLEWYGSEETHIEGYDLELDESQKGATCIKHIVDGAYADQTIEDLPSDIIKNLIAKKEIFNEKIKDLAEVYHVDEWELHSDVMDLVTEDDEPKNPRRRKRYKRARKKRLK